MLLYCLSCMYVFMSCMYVFMSRMEEDMCLRKMISDNEIGKWKVNHIQLFCLNFNRMLLKQNLIGNKNLQTSNSDRFRLKRRLKILTETKRRRMSYFHEANTNCQRFVGLIGLISKLVWRRGTILFFFSCTNLTSQLMVCNFKDLNR